MTIDGDGGGPSGNLIPENIGEDPKMADLIDPDRFNRFGEVVIPFLSPVQNPGRQYAPENVPTVESQIHNMTNRQLAELFNNLSEDNWADENSSKKNVAIFAEIQSRLDAEK